MRCHSIYCFYSDMRCRRCHLKKVEKKFAFLSGRIYFLVISEAMMPTEILLEGIMKVHTIGANHLEIEHANKTLLVSYDTVIAEYNHKTDKTRLDKRYWDYSATTGKHRNSFLNEGIAETRKKIESKEYKLADLNK